MLCATSGLLTESHKHFVELMGVIVDGIAVLTRQLYLLSSSSSSSSTQIYTLYTNANSPCSLSIINETKGPLPK